MTLTDNLVELERGADPDQPRELDPGLPPSDSVFRSVVLGIGLFVLVMTGLIGLFLGYQAIPTLHHYGLKFFTESKWQPTTDTIGIAAVLVGTVEVALVALAIGFPIALLTALYISEYAPRWLKSTLIALVDMMAAIPSVIYGIWGALWLEPKAIFLSRWLSQNLGWIPIFKVDTDPNAASWAKTQFSASAFIAGIVVAIMIVPLACAVMRGVFDLAPIGEREAAYALGSTRWGMIRAVVLPFGRGGIIGGTMLALGRALGETVAVFLIISTAYDIKIKILSVGTQTTSALIASLFGEATKRQLSALLTAGFVLFLITLGVNTVAAIFVNRSRSGAGVDV
ncbi:phosphate ABC transporter permease subunit PstC [Jatrophihabitans telluris]|uniref:Phosphate transport system permease protein n=1 Tax=Jatrophihabitans telluris TaxID=2038343 RepID=A0ABY4QZ65_9ACTN|nr:phosphate ABC transporter permease subunit PstC [Jatrophihabitans telluris]UQX88407.1 phosphate ABC transporter permease subunit PstC [Jatrophihabitans telluris]